jgi:transcriptional regulator with XRE-family HTH domain
MTQKELAKQLQIADSTLSYWEIGKYEPDNEALIKLSRFFNVPIDFILDGDFAKWDINGANVIYPNIESTNLSASDMIVSEANISYCTSADGFKDKQIAFDRIEFEDLAQEEIDMLAEYAVFIKSRRKSRKAK